MNIDPLRWAKFFASLRHGMKGQVYSNGLPYAFHLAQVELVARRFWQENEPSDVRMCSTEFLEACWLHDVLEDTQTKSKELMEMFGPEVTRLVQAVTNEPGANRKIRAQATYPKIREAGKRAVALKLCDRIANVEAGGSHVDMYKKEYEDFRRALYTPGENEVLWKHLDGIMKKDG